MVEEKLPTANSDFKPWGMEVNTFCMLMHLSMLIIGIIMPIVMWATNKDQSEEVNKHGKNILNFAISFAIYFFVSWLLMFVLIGAILFPAVAICGLVFTIIAAVKANKGEAWSYPMTIKFIS